MLQRSLITLILFSFQWPARQILNLSVGTFIHAQLRRALLSQVVKCPFLLFPTPNPMSACWSRNTDSRLLLLLQIYTISGQGLGQAGRAVEDAQSSLGPIEVFENAAFSQTNTSN